MNFLTFVAINIVIFCNAMRVHAGFSMINESTYAVQDTVIVKEAKPNNREYGPDQYYYWVSEMNDTLDFKLGISLYYGEVYLSVENDQPMLFSDVLDKIKLCIPMIREEYDLSKLSTISFRKPIYYLDLAQDLSTHYYKKFGNKAVNYHQWNQFLLNASITSSLNGLLECVENKNVRSYSFEKFRIATKKEYKEYLPDVDFSTYPDFVLDGYTGFSVRLY